jgi:hypothetical protein
VIPPDGGLVTGGPNVLQFHKNPSRDGHYVEPAFTKAAAATMHKDTAFSATIQGPTFAQPLYFEGGPGGKNILIVATEQNQVYALDAANGSAVWQKKVGTASETPVPRAQMPCGNLDNYGITGTPAIDAASRTLFVAAMTIDGGTKKHQIFALSVDDGSPRSGWPLDVSTVRAGATAFVADAQSQRGALTVVNGVVYVPYGGLFGDCGNYRGWVVGVPVNAPGSAKGYATTARGAGIWGPGGLASDGTSIYTTTGNEVSGNGTWGQSEAVLKFTAGPTYSGMAADYFRPSNWNSLDGSDTDLGSTGPVLVDVPGANPSRLVVATGKNGVAYLLDRNNLGGQGTGNGTTGEGVASDRIATGNINAAATTYRTAQGTYLVVSGNCQGGDTRAIRITATSPPAIMPAWCGQQGGYGGPISTTTDGSSEAIVWANGGGLSNHLVGFDGDTGQKIFPGTAPGDGLGPVTKWTSPIVARGRIYIAGDSSVSAFTTR